MGCINSQVADEKVVDNDSSVKKGKGSGTRQKPIGTMSSQELELDGLSRHGSNATASSAWSATSIATATASGTAALDEPKHLVIVHGYILSGTGSNIYR